MPKLGRRSDHTDADFMLTNHMLTRNAPFGTADTPNVRVKIVGGKPVTVLEKGASENDPKLNPLIEKASQIHPAALNSRNQKSWSYSSGTQGCVPSDALDESVRAFQDVSGSHVHISPNQKLNPRQVLPPINSPPKRESGTETDPRPGYDEAIQTDAFYLKVDSNVGQSKRPLGHDAGTETRATEYDWNHRLPSDASLPQEPIQLSRNEEMDLMAKLNFELRNFNQFKLQDVYSDCAGFDKDLTDWMIYQDLVYVFSKHQIFISQPLLKLICSMYVAMENPGKVNYVHVLTFLGAAMKSHLRQSTPPAVPKENYYKYPKEEVAKNPELFKDKDISKLLRMIEQAFMDNDADIHFEQLRQSFLMADRDHRDTLSREQIKDICYKNNLPLQDSILDKVIDKCDGRAGQYNWDKFIAYLERVQPQQTGLRIPTSKKPREYAKPVPAPGDNWPKVASARGTPGPQEKPPSQQRPQYNDYNNHNHHNPRDAESRHSRGSHQRGHDDDSPTTRLERPHSPAYSEPDNPNLAMPLTHPRTDKLNSIQTSLINRGRSYEMDDQIRRLEIENERTLKEIAKLKEEKNESQPWFQRFQKLAEALYNNDTSHFGTLPYTEARKLTELYNDTYNLRFSDNVISTSLQHHQGKSGHVRLQPYLQELGRNG